MERIGECPFCGSECVSLKTANQEEAVRKARELLPTVQATNLEVIATHVKVARKLAAQIRTSFPAHAGNAA
ncbi:MAG: hypothetical protein J5944_07810 [Lentisphaeria bacterium]|nr:hypothetical protein [Lentisphaeria bacterium]